MKILAFVDTHGSVEAMKKIMEKGKKKDIDILICAGDISVFEQDIDKIMKKLDSIGKPILMLPGNHESEKNMKELADKTKNVVYIHKGMLKIKGYTFIGFSGNGFSPNDAEFDAWSKKVERELKKSDKVVLITHAPPHKTKLDSIAGSHCGSRSIRKFIEKIDILLAVSGHIHENAGAEDVIKNTRVVNPGPFGKVFEI
ncbi:MAG: metallophosphoesterase [Candidatus Woesearchaeota archaeon]|nr:metallophosphoesterase [Candidatus Woesearchaeota archaeon]